MVFIFYQKYKQNLLIKNNKYCLYFNLDNVLCRQYYISMNETIREFLKSLDINYNKFNALEGSQIKRSSDINPILSRFIISKIKTETRKVSIADVVGYDYQCINLDRNLLNNLSRFFDRDGDGYHRRSLSMLDIPQEEIISQLESSFKKEPICLQEIEKGIYNVGNNGLHRFHVIKTHYLNELSKLKNKNDAKKLRDKYSFDAEITEVDYVKSYSNFLLRMLDKNLALELHYDSNYEFTGKSCLVDYSNPDLDEKVVLTDDQLQNLVNKKINKFLRNASPIEKKEFDELLKRAFKYESFKNYYNDILKQNQNGGFEWN